MRLVAVNHWPVAIETHQLNHPDARHYCVNLDAARPEELVPEGYLDLLMASPECTHHSRARGGKPIHDQSRMSAWHIVRWATTLRVKRILIENVVEFREWAPLGANGRPLKSKRGDVYRAFIDALRTIGYEVEARVLCAADYGDATTRERLFVLARRDRKRIVWPVPSHSRTGGVDLFGNVLQPWRAAREIIDWTIEGRSIFDRKKPLAPKTIARIAAGIKRYGGVWAEPFLVILRNNCTARSVDAPLPTITAGGGHIGLIEMDLKPFVLGQQSKASARSVENPVPTVSTAGAISLIEPTVEPFLVPPAHGERLRETPRTRDVRRPLPTVTSHGAGAIVEPFVTPYYGSTKVGKTVNEPLDTVTTKSRFGLVEPVVDSEGGRLVEVNGQLYRLDIRFRMLKNHELARAMGFSDDETEYEFVGTGEQVTRQIGNAVPVNTAVALVDALINT